MIERIMQDKYIFLCNKLRVGEGVGNIVRRFQKLRPQTQFLVQLIKIFGVRTQSTEIFSTWSSFGSAWQTLVNKVMRTGTDELNG